MRIESTKKDLLKARTFMNEIKDSICTLKIDKQALFRLSCFVYIQLSKYR